jgi:TPR repeat protein
MVPEGGQEGIGIAQHNRGRTYRESEGSFRNYPGAQWYHKAAEQGMASAAFDLGLMYDLGESVSTKR